MIHFQFSSWHFSSLPLFWFSTKEPDDKTHSVVFFPFLTLKWCLSTLRSDSNTSSEQHRNKWVDANSVAPSKSVTKKERKKTCCLDLTHEVHAANYVWLCALTNAGNNLTSDGWIKWRENQYYINENPMYMDDARHYCKQRHGDLISINSKDENTFIWKQVIFSHFHSFWRLNVE